MHSISAFIQAYFMYFALQAIQLGLLTTTGVSVVGTINTAAYISLNK